MIRSQYKLISQSGSLRSPKLLWVGWSISYFLTVAKKVDQSNMFLTDAKKVDQSNMFLTDVKKVDQSNPL